MRWLAAALVLWPAAAYAHASERMVILTLPTGWYILGAGAAVVLTVAVGLFVGRLPAFRAHRLFDRPALLPRSATSWFGAALFWALIAVGVWGTRDPLENLLPLTIWITLWVGLTLASVLIGNLWRDIEPWTGPVRAIRRLIGWQGSISLARLGYLPAVAGYLAFAWFEIVSLAPSDPFVLARAAAVYYLLILVIATAEGENWLTKGEFLTAYFAFVARIAPLWAEYETGRVRVMAGPPGAQVLRMAPLSHSAISFVTVILASVSFDGLHETFWWMARIGINPLDYPGRSAVWGINTLALPAFWALSAATILTAIRLGLPAGTSFRRMAGPMVLAILPIAAGYHVAHYLVALVTNGQYVMAALNDPFERGWDLFGLPEHWVSFGFLSTRRGTLTIWLAQFATILAAHLLAVLLGLKIAERFDGGHSVKTHLPMTLLMVGYTVFGLWLLSSATAG